MVIQNFDMLTDTVGMLKLLDDVQIRCEACGWIGFKETQAEALSSDEE